MQKANNAVPNSRKVNGKPLTGDVSLNAGDVGACWAHSGAISIGGGGTWTTKEFAQWLKSQGAFNHPYWMCKGSWSYASNRTINDTGCGNICLAGAVVEVMGVDGITTIRVTTPTTTDNNGIPNAQFTYINHGEPYSPGWRRDYNTKNKPTTGDVGAYPKSGGVVNGNVDATGYISGKGVYEAPGVRVYSSMNKPSPGELGAYTTIEVDNRVNAKGNKNIASKAVNGWWKCGDTGMIYQWGITRVLEPQEIIVVQLPVRFSNVCVSVMLTVNRLGSGDGIANGYAAVLSPSSFKLTNDYANTGISVGYYWFAVGY
ncbi:hypothetical protein C6H69_02130 [Photorhabdus luminescens]|nr:hypothetical protein C6H69_02130 [Photorhabdus luminescens]